MLSFLTSVTEIVIGVVVADTIMKKADVIADKATKAATYVRDEATIISAQARAKVEAYRHA